MDPVDSIRQASRLSCCVQVVTRSGGWAGWLGWAAEVVEGIGSGRTGASLIFRSCMVSFYLQLLFPVVVYRQNGREER